MRREERRQPAVRSLPLRGSAGGGSARTGFGRVGPNGVSPRTVGPNGVSWCRCGLDSGGHRRSQVQGAKSRTSQVPKARSRTGLDVVVAGPSQDQRGQTDGALLGCPRTLIVLAETACEARIVEKSPYRRVVCVLLSDGHGVSSPGGPRRHLPCYATLLSPHLPSPSERGDYPHSGVLPGVRTRKDRRCASCGLLHVKSSSLGGFGPDRPTPRFSSRATSTLRQSDERVARTMGESMVGRAVQCRSVGRRPGRCRQDRVCGGEPRRRWARAEA